MELRPAKASELKSIQHFVDEVEGDAFATKYSLAYFKQLHREGIIIVAESASLIGVCLGTYNKIDKCADLLAVSVAKEYRKRGTGSMLVLAFEQVAKDKGAKQIDFFANMHQIAMFKGLGYTPKQKCVSFKKYL
jgi:N-acetylglutamate synthase-like GNAT family acetyltransferase